MATFSPTDAALEGFRITREKPRLLLRWAVVYTLATLLSTVLLITYAGDTLMALRAAEESGETDPAFAVQALLKLLPLSLLGLVFTSVIGAASFRVILRPEDDRFAYLRLGADEWRLVLLTLMFIALWIGATFVVVLALGIVGAIIGAIAAVAMGEGALEMVAALGALISLAVFPVWVWLLVKFSLAWPMTFAERRIQLFRSWRVTRGHFWRLFGAYLLAVILAVVVFALVLVIYAGVAAVVTGGDLAAVGAVFGPDMSSAATYFTLPMVIYTVFVGAIGPLQYLILFAPAAIAYRDLAAGVEVHE